MMTIYSLIYVTCSSEEEAHTIAHNLLADQLVACANIYPEIESLYLWENSLREETECVLLLKTRSALFKPLKKRIKELHSYQVPSILEVPITHGNPEFLAWIDTQTAGAEKQS